MEVPRLEMKVIFAGKNFDRGLDDTDAYTILKVAESMGLVPVESTDVTAQLCICVDYWSREKGLLKDMRSRGLPLFLVKQEPPVILPEHGDTNPFKLFTAVYSRGLASSSTPLRFPNSWQIPSEKWDSHRRINRFAAISADKWSAMRGELYTLRRQIYTSTDQVDLFGRGWEMPSHSKTIMLIKEMVLALRVGEIPLLPDFPLYLRRPSNYRGAVPEKTSTLSRYDYSLVIENSVNYMSEKLMDSLLAGTLPVYVGPNVSQFNIPTEFVIQAAPDEASVRDSMSQALSTNSTTHRENLWDWLSSDSTREAWQSKQLNRELLTQILSDFSSWKASRLQP